MLYPRLRGRNFVPPMRRVRCLWYGKRIFAQPGAFGVLRGRQKYDTNLPFFISEYGGIKWSSDNENSWGYGDAPKTDDEFIQRYKGLTEEILKHKDIMGFCYTQLYDVEQEQNGLMTYDRKFKFDPEIFKKINTKKYWHYIYYAMINI